MLGLCQAQSIIGEWQSYTSPLEINAMVIVDDIVFSATNGGLLEYSFTTGKFKTYTNIDGLTNTDLRAIAQDSTGNLWLGGGNLNGSIQLYRDGVSIEEFDFELSEIIAIEVTASIVFVAYKKNQNFGIMEFQLRDDEWIYKDAYENWPMAFNEVKGIGVIGDQLYLAADNGLIRASYTDTNLKNPLSWNTASDDITSGIQSFYANGDRIVFQHDNDIYIINQFNEIELVYDYFNYTLLQISMGGDGAVWGTLTNKLIKFGESGKEDRKSTRLNSSHTDISRMPSSA